MNTWTTYHYILIIFKFMPHSEQKMSDQVSRMHILCMVQIKIYAVWPAVEYFLPHAAWPPVNPVDQALTVKICDGASSGRARLLVFRSER